MYVQGILILYATEMLQLHHRLWQVLNRSCGTNGSDSKFSGMLRGGVEFPDNFLPFIQLVRVDCHCLSGKVLRELF